MHRLLSDPFVAREIDDAVAPFVGRLDAGEIAWMRDQLASLCENDRGAAAALRGAHPRNVDHSGERAQPALERLVDDPAATG